MTSRGDQGGARWWRRRRQRLVALGDELLRGGDSGQRRDGPLLGGADGAAGVGELERLAELLLVLEEDLHQRLIVHR
jgi:hypothetical protein